MLKIKMQYPVNGGIENKNIKTLTLANKDEAKHLIGKDVLVWERDRWISRQLVDIRGYFKVDGFPFSYDFIAEIPEPKFGCTELYIPENVDYHCIPERCECSKAKIRCFDCVYHQTENYELYRKCLLTDGKYRYYKVISVEECE